MKFSAGAVLPGLEWWSVAGKEHGSAEAGDDLADCLPIRVFDWCRPLDRVEPFVAALGAEPAAVRWDLGAWLAVPEAALEGVSEKYAFLTRSVNSRDLYQQALSRDHTVHVHVRDGEQVARIQWLADQGGGRFTGRLELALPWPAFLWAGKEPRRRYSHITIHGYKSV
ncbi:hypothetical protein [Nonomuraea sp. NPDC049784]|uniref:hypothetical protein n=1 Tax=Nonomuraea sp. NPDC049784 TaxID=3154361 RepID=UPI0034065809